MPCNRCDAWGHPSNACPSLLAARLSVADIQLIFAVVQERETAQLQGDVDYLKAKLAAAREVLGTTEGLGA